MEILKVENLTKIYGKNSAKVVALDNVSFSVEKGEFVAIVGASGSGKSTLLHLIGGVDYPTKGKVIVDNIDVYQLNEEELAKYRRQKVGLIYQFYNLLPILNIEENITLPVLLDKKTVDKNYLNELINILNLKERINHLPNELSGGEQQRVAIARTLINRPSLVLADEPTGNLDSKASIEIIKLLKQANETYNQTIIMVTHDINLAKYANRLIKIADGKIVSDTYENIK